MSISINYIIFLFLVFFASKGLTAQDTEQWNRFSQGASNDKIHSNSASPDYNLSNGFGLYVGPNFGRVTAFNVGVRWYHIFNNNRIGRIIFMPETYIALGNDVGFGINANGIVPFNINKNLEPYAGVGIGANYLGSKLIYYVPNLILGASYKVGPSNSIFIDYTIRGNINQAALGYKCSF